MILPSKHLSQERALLTVGGRILQFLSQPKTVSALWEELTPQTGGSSWPALTLSYDSFVLALDFLNLIGAVEMEAGV